MCLTVRCFLGRRIRISSSSRSISRIAMRLRRRGEGCASIRWVDVVHGSFACAVVRLYECLVKVCRAWADKSEMEGARQVFVLVS